MWEAYAFTLMGVVLGQIAPGPNLLAVAGVALGQSRRAAWTVAAGVATAIFVWVVVAALGLASLIALYPALLTLMKLLGGGYLLFLAIRALRSAIRGGEVAIGADADPLTPPAAFRRGLLVNLTNPKSALMWAAVATFLFGSGLSTAAVIGFAPIGFASALVVYGTYGTLFSSRLARRAYRRFSRVAEALFGLAFGAIGGKLAADGVLEAVR